MLCKEMYLCSYLYLFCNVILYVMFSKMEVDAPGVAINK